MSVTKRLISRQAFFTHNDISRQGKFTLEQDMKAQRDSRGIALLFL
jgi:hypothetical protein